MKRIGGTSYVLTKADQTEHAVQLTEAAIEVAERGHTSLAKAMADAAAYWSKTFAREDYEAAEELSPTGMALFWARHKYQCWRMRQYLARMHRLLDGGA